MDQAKYLQGREKLIGESRVLRPEFLSYYEFPCLNDDTGESGFDPHYLYHVAWAIKKIADSKPPEHVDISSSLSFSTAIRAFTRTTYIDYRPAQIHLENLECVRGDLTDNSYWIDKGYKSLSCMHVVEHIGLGRYGDPINAMANISAMNNLIEALSNGGKLLFVVPVGKAEIYFNAHRVYSANWIKNFFSRACDLKEFYLIPPNPNFPPILNCDLSVSDQFSYACGCFEFVKRQ